MGTSLLFCVCFAPSLVFPPPNVIGLPTWRLPRVLTGPDARVLCRQGNQDMLLQMRPPSPLRLSHPTLHLEGSPSFLHSSPLLHHHLHSSTLLRLLHSSTLLHHHHLHPSCCRETHVCCRHCQADESEKGGCGSVQEEELCWVWKPPGDVFCLCRRRRVPPHLLQVLELQKADRGLVWRVRAVGKSAVRNMFQWRRGRRCGRW